MALILYFECGFRYFWRDLTPETLRDYALRLDEVFHQNDRPDGFSPDEFVNTVQGHLGHYNPHSPHEYCFRVYGSDDYDTWEIDLRVTQIPHVEGGIVRAAPQNEHRLRLAHSLLEHKVANSVSVNEFVKAKGLWRFLPHLPDSTGTEIGENVFIYLWDRLGKIPDASFNLRWAVRRSDGFNFNAFADRVADILHPEIVELTHSPDADQLPAFMQSCDERLQSSLNAHDLNELFALIQLLPDLWFEREFWFGAKGRDRVAFNRLHFLIERQKRELKQPKA